MTAKPLEQLLRAAVQAPSGDNMQPWRFLVDASARRIELLLDESRDQSPMNAGQRMSRIAVGAALENVVCAARSLGWEIELEEPSPPALAAVRLVSCPEAQNDVDPAIAARVTNRRVYSGTTLPEDLVRELQRRTQDEHGVRTHWIVGRDRLNVLARLMGRSDALMLGEPSMRRAFLDNIRFDLPADAEADEGLPLASLELSRADRTALRFLAKIPDWTLKIGGASRKFAAASRRLVASSSGVCIVVEPDGSPRSELLVGQATERAWLALTALGLAVQPMMSMAILESVRCRGSQALMASLGRERTEALLNQFRTRVPEMSDAKLAFIMRFGFAASPTCRTGRLSLAAVT